MIIADTGFWLALADQKDSHHHAAHQAFQTHDETLITTWPVMTETCYLLLDRKLEKYSPLSESAIAAQLTLTPTPDTQPPTPNPQKFFDRAAREREKRKEENSAKVL